MEDILWTHSVFSNNRDRLLTSDVAQQFFAEVSRQANLFMSTLSSFQCVSITGSKFVSHCRWASKNV